MNKIRIKETLLVSSIALALSACGGNSGSTVENESGKDNVAAYQLKNLPAQRSIDIPKSLLTKQADSTERALSRSMVMSIESDGGMGNGTEPVLLDSPVMMPVEPDGGIGDGAGPIPFPMGPDGNMQEISFGYLQIKDSAFTVELSRLEQEREVLMLDAVWDDIKSRCDGTALGSACSIPENEISLNVTEALVKANDEINKRIDDLYESQFGDVYSAGFGSAVSGGNSGVSTAAVDPNVMPEPQDTDLPVLGEPYNVMPEPQETDFPALSEPYIYMEEATTVNEPWDEPQSQSDFVVGSVVPLGAISYIQHGVEEKFQYEVEMEPKYIEPVYVIAENVEGEVFELKGAIVESENFFIAWSHDEKRVKSGFRYEDDQSSYSSTFSYLDQGGEKIVTIRNENSFDMGAGFGKGRFSSMISLNEKENDSDGAVNIRFNNDDFMPGFVTKMSSKGRASDDGGFLRTEGKFINTLDEKAIESVFNTEEIFDGKGKLLKLRWCDTACDQDENWKEGDIVALPFPVPALPEGPFEDFDFEESEFYMNDDELELIEGSFYEVAITVSGLSIDGEYVIVSESISGNERPGVFENIIGGGVVNSESSDFYYWGEKGQLDTAIVYFIVFDEESFTFQSEEIIGAEIIIDHDSKPSVMMPVEPDNGIGGGAAPIPVAAGDEVGFSVLHYSSYIANGTFSSEGTKVLTNKNDYEAELLKYSNDKSASIDFSESNVLLVDMGQKYNGGFSIEVSSIVENKESVVVTVVSSMPGMNCPVDSSLTNPFQFVEIPVKKEIIINNVLILGEMCL